MPAEKKDVEALPPPPREAARDQCETRTKSLAMRHSHEIGAMVDELLALDPDELEQWGNWYVRSWIPDPSVVLALEDERFLPRLRRILTAFEQKAAINRARGRKATGFDAGLADKSARVDLLLMRSGLSVMGGNSSTLAAAIRLHRDARADDSDEIDAALWSVLETVQPIQPDQID